MIDLLQRAVHELTALLLWPVVVLLLYSVARALYLAGEMAVEALGRRGEAVHLADPGRPPPGMARRHGIALYVTLLGRDPGASPWLIADRAEAALARRIDRSRVWVRLGPALGLAGTLIPLGPALLGLAANDLASLSSGLIIAFGTTVLGLFSGGLGWVISTVAERWYRLDLTEVRHALEAQEARS